MNLDSHLRRSILDSHLRRSRKGSQTPSIPDCRTKAQRTSCFHPDPWAQEDSGGSRKPAWHLLLEPELGDRQRQPEWWERCYFPPISASSERRGGGGSALPAPFPSLSLSLPSSPPLHRATTSLQPPCEGVECAAAPKLGGCAAANSRIQPVGLVQPGLCPNC